MKIGFSFGRCLRDIVKGTVVYDEVFLIVSGTAIRDSSHIDDVVAEYLYRPDYLMGLDEGTCIDVAMKLYLGGKLYQPRLAGQAARHIVEDAVWMDIAPTIMGKDADGSDPSQSEQVVQAWKQYQLALKMTALRKFPGTDHLKDNGNNFGLAF